MAKVKNRPSITGFIVLGAALTAAPTPALWSQEVHETPVSKGKMVKLWLTALDSRSRLVTDLAKEDLRVTVDGEEQELAVFESKPSDPLVLGLLIDISGSRRAELPGEEAKVAGQFFRKLLGERDQAFVVAFSLKCYTLIQHTNSIAHLEEAVEEVHRRAPWGGTALYECLYQTCRNLSNTDVFRTVLVVVSDGMDNFSQHSRDEAVSEALETNSVIYAVWPGRMAGHERRGGRVLSEITRSTGGMTFSGSTEKDFIDAFDKIAILVRTQYALGFFPRGVDARKESHNLKVQCARRGVRFLVRDRL